MTDAKKPDEDEPESRAESGAVQRARPLPPVASRWKPGQSGNPGGKSKGLAEIRAEFLPQVPTVMKKLLMLIVKHDGAVAVAAAKEFLDRVCGKAAQPIIGQEGAPAVQVDIPGLVAALRRYVVDDIEKEDAE
jgi:hypothetical protein